MKLRPPCRFVPIFLIMILLAACADREDPQDQAQNTTPTKASEDVTGAGEVGARSENPAPAKSPGTTAGQGDEDPETGAFEVLVFGSVEESLAWLKSEGWWGEPGRETPLQVPRVLLTGITERWGREAQSMTVAAKKEAFYRLMLPLVLHANELVLARRASIIDARDALSEGRSLSGEDVQRLRRGAVQLRVAAEEEVAALGAASQDWLPLIDEMLYRLDVVPPGLALGQAAYESGYATSRFAREGNALFGQWTYGGEGLKPEQQRESLGDHRIAAFDWPFDSVRGYYLNLFSHPAYEPFRQLRAERRAAGLPLDSLVLADGLIRYSERGQEYVDTLKGIIRVNKLNAADDAVFRDEPLRFYVGAESPEEAERLRAEIEALRDNGELQEIVEEMNLF